MKRTIFEPEHVDFRESVRRFIAEEITPNHETWEAEGIVPRELFAKAAEKGMLAMAVPEQYGGLGVDDFRFNQVLLEEVQYAGVSGSGLGLTLHNDICLPYFLEYCTEEQRERWLPGIASGELITAVAMTEPGIGSDLASMSTSALRDNGHYVVNGSKTFITNGINGDLVITAVKTDPSLRHKGISLVIVERGMDGFERGRNLEKIGMHAQDTAELFFNDMPVPVENRLGEEGAGFSYLVANLAQERLSIAIAGVAAVPGRAGLDARVRQGAPGVRPADRLVSELALRAGRDGDRDRPRDRLLRPGGDGAERRHAQPSRTPRRRSTGAPSCRAVSSIAACSCTAATATCSSTRSRAPTPMPASPASTAAPARSCRRSSAARWASSARPRRSST